MTVTPRSAIANSVMKIVRQQTVTASTLLGEGEAEVIEFNVGEKCPGLGRTLSEISEELPRRSIIATIIRGDKVFVPGGKDTIEPGDAVVLITKAEVRERARKYLQGE
jgi:Trk K+ transport system NAD-binding subunit